MGSLEVRKYSKRRQRPAGTEEQRAEKGEEICSYALPAERDSWAAFHHSYYAKTAVSY